MCKKMRFSLSSYLDQYRHCGSKGLLEYFPMSYDSFKNLIQSS